MRKIVRNHILEMLTTIWDGIKQVKTLTSQGAEQILTDCYCAVQAIENTLQQRLSEMSFKKYETLTARLKELLEETNINVAQNIVVAEVTKKIKSNLKQLRKFLNEEPEIRLEIVFLPYKASMWTSLESIWKAAWEDPRCDVYVIPIPYWNLKLKENGECERQEFVYEGDMFPDYVPITRYDSFSLPGELPDMIFIHNPYDNSNNLTRIPEEYYSINLKKLTELLVYSPYFTLGTLQGGTIPPQFFMPVIANAHKIVAQSKIVAQYYMKAGCPAKKILDFGSPKTDAVIKPIKEPNIPEEWVHKTQGRKVFLLNTHFSYFLIFENYPKNMFALANIWAVIEAVLKTPNAVLIWRPHPLQAQMMQSRGRLDILEQLVKMETAVMDAPNGLLDKTGSYMSAFKLSDAYITTRSSLDYEYLLTGKPMFDLIVQSRYDWTEKQLMDEANDPLMNMKNVFYTWENFDDMDYMRSGEYQQITARRGAGIFNLQDTLRKEELAKSHLINAINGFIKMVIQNGDDPLQEKRKAESRKAFRTLDGTCGQKIFEELINLQK